MRAVNHAYVILGWQENLAKDETPPEWMWALDEELEKWFDEVEEARREKYGLRDDDTIVPMMQNQMTAGRRRRG
jgi:hypothetical protein